MAVVNDGRKAFDKVYDGEVELFAIDEIVSNIRDVISGIGNDMDAILEKISIPNGTIHIKDISKPVANASKSCKEITEFTRKFKVVHSSYEDTIKQLQLELDEQRRVNLEYRNEIDKYKTLSEERLSIINNSNAKILEILTSMIKAWDENGKRNTGLRNRVVKLIEYIDGRADLIANAEGAKRRKDKHPNRGKEHMAYKDSVDDSELIEMYNNSGCKLTKEIQNHFSDMTYQGMKNRLVKAGVWKGRQN